ncbi:MAG: ABC transporter substrate-binding protein [Acidobacteriota bacterium]|nr:ABC transporter substrate-binding protein [Acidobacteriota bacterium]
MSALVQRRERDGRERPESDRGWPAYARTTLAVSLVLLLSSCAPPRSGRIVIGAKNFTEQVILGELLAQEIEAVSAAEGRPEAVERRFYLAGSYVCHQALVAGRIDAYVEYTGTALTAILKQPLPPLGERTAERVFARVAQLYRTRYGIEVEPSLGFEDTFAIVVRADDARRLGLTTVSQLTQRIDDAASGANLPHAWRLGVGYEFESRPDGLSGLSAAYGLHLAVPPRTMDLGLLYRALAAGQVDVVAGNSTDGPIRALSLAVLADDRHYFPPYEAVPLVRGDALAAHPAIGRALSRLAGRFTAAEVQAMNDAVDGQHLDPADVVRDLRRRKGL